jgi:hypothetical protein
MPETDLEKPFSWYTDHTVLLPYQRFDLSATRRRNLQPPPPDTVKCRIFQHVEREGSGRSPKKMNFMVGAKFQVA